MSSVRKWMRILVGLLFIVLLLVPIGMIWGLTNLEMRQFDRIPVPSVSQKAYGAALPVFRQDMKEFVFLSGQYVSENRFFMELPKLRNPFETRIIVSVGDYIEQGEIIGYTHDGKTEILSSAEGIVLDIHLGDNSYFILESDTELSFACYADESLIRTISKDTASLQDENGQPVSLLRVERRVNEKGERRVFLQTNEGLYGQRVNNFKLFTGTVFTNALVVPNECLFHISGNQKEWYVRVLDGNKNAVGNQQVKIGFSDGQFTCVTGLSEGTLLDSGYALLMGVEQK